MDIIKGDGPMLAGAKIGEHILVTLTSGSVERVVYSDMNKYGIEGHSTKILNNPLQFFPFANILKVVKDKPMEKDLVLRIR